MHRSYQLLLRLWIEIATHIDRCWYLVFFSDLCKLCLWCFWPLWVFRRLFWRNFTIDALDPQKWPLVFDYKLGNFSLRNFWHASGLLLHLINVFSLFFYLIIGFSCCRVDDRDLPSNVVILPFLLLDQKFLPKFCDNFFAVDNCDTFKVSVDSDQVKSVVGEFV